MELIKIKRKIFVAALIIACLALVAAGTVAYYTYDATARNVITSGAIDIAIEEWHIEDGEKVPYPYRAGLDVMPGRVVSKIATVKNSDEAAYVRARYTVTVKDPEGNVLDLDATETALLVAVLGMSDNWVEKDGWYYYDTVLNTDESTEPLFEEVEFSGKNITSEHSGHTIELTVEAEAVQAANNGDSWTDAMGWEE